MYSLQPNPDAVLALQLAPAGPEAHAAMAPAGLRHRGFAHMHLSVEGFGLDLAGLRRRLTRLGWFARAPTWIHAGSWRALASHTDFSPLSPLPPGQGNPLSLSGELIFHVWLHLDSLFIVL